MDYTYKANNNKLLNESSFTIEEFCYDNDIEDPRTFIRILRQLCDFDDIEQADNSLLRKALVKYQQTLKESSDYIYKAKIGDKLYLQGNSQDGWDTTSDPDEAAIFESKTEPTQIINQMKKDGKISKNDKITVLSESISDFKGHLLFGTAVLGIGALSAIDHNKAKLTADKLGIELAETEYGPHKAAGLVGPIYEYKYGMKGPMNIDSLCEYLKNHTDYDEITYEDEGDNYVINYTDNYAIHQTAANATVTKHRTSKGNLNLPKEYFDVSFVLDESKTALKEAKIKTPYGEMQVVDEFVIQDDDKLAFVQKAEAKYKELDKDGWFSLENTEPYWYAFPYNRAKFTLCANKTNKVCFIDYRKEGYDNLFNESNVTIAPWKRERAERLIEEANKIDPSYSFVEYDIGPKKEIKYKIFKNDDEYVGTFDVFTDDPYNSPYRYFFHHVNVGGLEFQGMTIDEFNKDFNEFIELDERVGHKALNKESLLKEFFFYAPPHDKENEEKDTIIGYIAAVRDYQTKKTKYIDDNGDVCDSKSQAKVFDTKGKADNYSYEYCPEGWTHFVVALKISDILNEARVFAHSSGFGLSGHYDYEMPRKEPLYVATETNEDDGELYFDERGCTTEFKTDAKRFTSEEEALEFAKNNVIFGEPGAKLYEKSEENTIYKEENTMKKLFENSDLFDYVLNESSLKENISSLEWLLDKAYVSEYRMVGKNSAEVRVRHTPELLTSESMAARFDEDIPDGYRLEVDYLGEDPILGRNFDIYEVQLVKD